MAEEKDTGKTLAALKKSSSIRQEIVQRLEGCVIESIIKYDRGDKALDLTAERRQKKNREHIKKNLTEYIEKTDQSEVQNMEMYTDIFRKGFAGSRGGDENVKMISRFPQNICRIVTKFYTEAGDIVVDPFAGHNSRAEAVWRSGRNYYGQDLCKEFMEDNFKVREILLKEDEGKLFKKKSNLVIDLTEGDSRHLPWADNFGDFTITSPPYWCLVPETLILTKRGTIQIQELVAGDLVYTHKGRWRQVTGVSNREISDTILNVRLKNNNTNLRLTKNHKVLAIKSDSCSYFKESSVCRPNCGYLRNGNWKKHKCTNGCVSYEPTWILPTELTKQHYVAVPIDRTVIKSENVILRETKAKNQYDFTLKTNIEVNGDFARFIGYYLAEGYSNTGGVDLCFNKNEVEYIEDVKNLFKTVFGITHTYYNEQENAAHIGVYCTPLQEWLNENCGNGALNKKIPDFLTTENLDIQKQLLLGLYSGDGCDYSEGYNYCTVSKTLKEQMKLILLRFNISPTMGEQKGGIKNVVGRMCYTNTSYTINVIDRNGIRLLDDVFGREHRKSNIGTNGYSYAFIVGDYIYYRVSKVEDLEYTGKVYNCEVEEDNSYTTSVCTVHNCLEYYGDEKEQLGYGEKQTYEEFLQGMQEVANENFRVLKPGAFCIWFINDFRINGKFYNYHGDTRDILVKAGFEQWDIIISDLGPSLRAVFLQNAFKSKVLPKRHEYGIVVRKPGGPKLNASITVPDIDNFDESDFEV